jgi:hypothetical protein
VGCGITRSEEGVMAVYFTWNGTRLPGIKLDRIAPDTTMYPVVSVKGKLTHFELIK